MTIENKKTSYQLIFVHIFRKKHFKDNLENFMSESLNATNTPLKYSNPKFSYTFPEVLKVPYLGQLKRGPKSEKETQFSCDPS